MANLDHRVKELFGAAFDLTGAPERDAFLDRACAGEPDLRRRVEGLLQAEAKSSSFAPDTPPPTESIVVERPGDRIGRYKLLEKIGEGGFGIVYMAEQREPVRRKVALKIIRAGMDTRQVIARFEAERQALAMMDHPNIAKILDGGVTGEDRSAGCQPAVSPTGSRRAVASAENVDGSEDAQAASAAIQQTGSLRYGSARPYFVMELVRGIKITDFCDQNHLGLKERLELFMQVCHAVQHAHQKGVIHRDLKPSNILVTINDGVPVPKVIDFGIAKATQQDLTEKTLFTAFGQFMGTPAYMSPEQTVMTSLDIDTRSDIYSLGVLLYELLTGTTPFDTQELLKAGFDEMRRVIRETEPPTPSRRVERLSELRVEKEGQRPAGARRTLNSQLQPLSSDLDWIVMKCLEKDRARRYETANGLAADLQRHLGNEPVVARPPSAAYRFQKMVRRNKGVVGAATAVMAALVIGLAVAVSQILAKHQAYQQAEAALGKARQAEQRAGEEAAVAKAVTAFLREDLLSTAASGYQAKRFDAPVNPNLTVAEALDRAAERIGDRFADQPLVEAGIRHTLGQTYLDLGNDFAAIRHLERALELRRAKLGIERGDTRSTMHDLAKAYEGIGQYTNGTRLLEALLDFYMDRFGTNHPDTLVAMNNLGVHYVNANRAADGARLLEEVLAHEEATKGRENLTGPLGSLAHAYSSLGQTARAIELSEEALGNLTKKRGPEDLRTVLEMCNLAMYYREARRDADALPLLEKGLTVRRAKLGPSHPDTLGTFRMLAELYQKLDRSAEAETLYTEAAAAARSTPQNGPSRTASQIRDLAVFLSSKGRDGEAELLFREALDLGRKVVEGDPRRVLDCLRDYARLLLRQRRVDEAERLGREALNMAQQKRMSTSPDIEAGLDDVAEVFLEARSFHVAEPLYRELLARRQHRLPGANLDVFNPTVNLAKVLSEWAWSERPMPTDPRIAKSEPAAHAREAEQLLRQCLAANETDPDVSRGRSGVTKVRLGGALVSVAVADPALDIPARLSMFEEAERFLRAGQPLVEASQSTRTVHKREAMELFVRLYQAWTELAPGAGKAEHTATWTERLRAFDQERAIRKTTAKREASP